MATTESESMTASDNMSRDTLVEECKTIALKHFRELVGINNIESLILYGSLARDEDGLGARAADEYFESDMDLVVVIKNIGMIRHITSLSSLSDTITHELRTRHLLSKVSLIVTTEGRLINAKPSVLTLELKLNGKVIFGKDVISILPRYDSKDIPVRQLTRYVLPFMVRLLERLAQVEFEQKKPGSGNNNNNDNYTPVLKPMKKMASGLLRAIVIKAGTPINPFNLNEIKVKRSEYHFENSTLLEHLLEIHDRLKYLIDSEAHYCSKEKVKDYWIEMANLFKLTMTALTGNEEFSSEKQLFGDSVDLVRRLQLALYISPRFLGINKFKYLIKAVILVIKVGPDYSYLPLYCLFQSVPSLLESETGKIQENQVEEHDSRKLWLGSFNHNFEIWTLSSCIFADQF